jgi:hypothetical protein
MARSKLVARYARAFAVLVSMLRITRNGIYFLNLSDSPNGRIDFFDFAARETILNLRSGKAGRVSRRQSAPLCPE